MLKKRGLNYHTLLEGRRKPKDEDAGIAAHAYGVRTACLPCIFENFLRFLTQVKANASCCSECRCKGTNISLIIQ